MLILKNSSLVSISELSKGNYKNDVLTSNYFFHLTQNAIIDESSNPIRDFKYFSTENQHVWNVCHDQLHSILRSIELMNYFGTDSAPSFLVCLMLLIYFKAVSFIPLSLPKSCFNSREYTVYCSGLNVRFLVFTKLDGFWGMFHCIALMLPSLIMKALQENE